MSNQQSSNALTWSSKQYNVTGRYDARTAEYAYHIARHSRDAWGVWYASAARLAHVSSQLSTVSSDAPAIADRRMVLVDVARSFGEAKQLAAADYAERLAVDA